MQAVLSIFEKEVASFFNSLIAYVVIAVFLTGAGLFFWAFEYNILAPGNTFATMENLFFYGPYLFLFLIPAITMRAFSDEIRTGTFELLTTKPLTDGQIILGKYLASVFLVMFALLPTLIYYLTVNWLAEPVGNMDHGATWGAYMGLIFLGAIFGAIGILTSALSSSQIVAFILAVFLSFIFYTGFELLAGLKALGSLDQGLIRLGMISHYQSISRGVIDSRDLIYFGSFVAIALILTHLVLQAKKQ